MIATYVNAGWLREQVCIYMCPYARFQSAMFDEDTLIVSYDRTRGEPRGARKRTGGSRPDGLGDCVDCELCVQVCPTGIDIRNGLQYQCIGCAHCIDACDQVMDKMGYDRGLVRYTTHRALAGLGTRLLRPRVIGYAAALGAMIALFVWALLERDPLAIDVIRDRGALFQLHGDKVRNDYTITLMNKSETRREIALRAITANGEGLLWLGPERVLLEAGEVSNVAFALEVDGDRAPETSFDVEIEACADATCTRERSRFFSPSGTTRQ